MTQIEYKKILMERRRNSHELLKRAHSVGFVYPVDLHYFWEYMQEKNIGLPYCLGMIYQLGYADAKKAASPHADQSKGLTATETTETGCHIHYTTEEGRLSIGKRKDAAGNQEEAEK